MAHGQAGLTARHLEAAIVSPDVLGIDPAATIVVQAAVIAELRAANAEQARLLATLQGQIAELERRLGQDSSNSSRPPFSDGLGKPARPQRRADAQAAWRWPGNSPALLARTWPRSPSPTRSSGMP